MSIAASPAASVATANAASSAATSGTNANGTLAFTQNFNTFLTLLTTQLQNQDPLSPMDSNAFTQQLVEFSEVEQQINTNTNLTNLVQLQTANDTISSLPVVGRTIQYSAAQAALTNGQATFAYTLPTAATSATATLTNASGQIVYSASVSGAAGNNAFVWNGQNMAGQQQPNGGIYTLDVTATSSAGTAITPAITASGVISSVSTQNGTTTFNVSGVQVPISELVTISPASSS
jgi:flagellar basal-body rod modification protein FlgD